MTTDVHAVAAHRPPRRPLPVASVAFWTCVALAVAAAVVRPFMPPRAMTDTAGDLQ